MIIWLILRDVKGMPILEQRGQDGTDKNVSCWLPVSCALWDGITYGLGFGMVCTCTKTIIITAQSAHAHEDNIHYRSVYYLHNKTVVLLLIKLFFAVEDNS